MSFGIGRDFIIKSDHIQTGKTNEKKNEIQMKDHKIYIIQK